MKRPRLSSLPKPSPQLVEDILVSGGFFGGIALVAAGVALIYLPAGLIAAGASVTALAVLYTVKQARELAAKSTARPQR